jgi:uncharacterized protein YkwD
MPRSRSLRVVGLALCFGLIGCYTGGVPQGEETASTGEASTGDASTGDGSSSSSGDASGSGDESGDVSTSAADTGVDADSDDTTTTGEPTTSTTEEPTTTTDDPSTTSTTGEPEGYCAPTADWQAGWSALEDEVVTIANQRRAEGANCGSKGSFGPAGPLKMDPLLRCAARMHSKDMVDRDFFSHDNPDGESPWDRIAKTGYGGYSGAGENIAAGSATAAAVIDQWMNSDGHCANIMNPAFNWIGVGYYPGGGYGHYWTQVFTQK